MITPLGRMGDGDFWHCETIDDVNEFQQSRPFDRVVYAHVPFDPILWLMVWWYNIRGMPPKTPDYRRGYLVTFEETQHELGKDK